MFFNVTIMMHMYTLGGEEGKIYLCEMLAMHEMTEALTHTVQ